LRNTFCSISACSGRMSASKDGFSLSVIDVKQPSFSSILRWQRLTFRYFSNLLNGWSTASTRADMTALIKSSVRVCRSGRAGVSTATRLPALNDLTSLQHPCRKENNHGIIVNKDVYYRSKTHSRAGPDRGSLLALRQSTGPFPAQQTVQFTFFHGKCC
jgi:hypothetical protein